jgi:YYY domain-containing protein
LRLHGVNWDSGTGVHPDERFVGDTLVHNLQFPTSPFDLFNPTSGWNPAVAASSSPGVPINGHIQLSAAGFNYGSLPLYLIFLFARLMAWLGGWVPGWSSWQTAPQAPIEAGRVLSALADTVTVFLVYRIAARLGSARSGLIGAALYACAVLAIQLSHFTTVDILLTTFTTGALLASIDVVERGRRLDYAVLGIWGAAAVATKASAVPLAAVVVIAHLWRREREGDLLGRRTLTSLWPLLGAGLVALFLFQPYMFTDWTDFWSALQAQDALASGSTIAFYTVKWVGTAPLIYPFDQLTFYSLGLPLALLTYAGFAYQVWRALRGTWDGALLVTLFVAAYFVSAGLLFMKYLRYMEPIVPPLCILGALLIGALLQGELHPLPRGMQRAGVAVGMLALVLNGAYALAYEHIYSVPLSRVSASCWMIAHIPASTPIAQDTFDETLPLGGGCGAQSVLAPSYPQAGGQPMPAYGSPDTPATAQTIASILSQAGYYLTSSRRARDSVAAEPAQYPYYHRFYQLLFGSGKGVQDPLGFTLVHAFIVHPQLGPWTFTQAGANQNFDEYDHPPVYIFRNTGHLAANQIENVLTINGAVQPPSGVAQPPKSLLLSPAAIAADQQDPPYAVMFPASGPGMRFPVPVWLLMVELIGLAALPISLRLFGRLRDAGFVIAKTVGILLLSYLAWILPSVHAAYYGRREIALCLGAVIVISLLWGVRLPAVVRIVRERLRPILVTEGIFLIGYLAFVYIRALYPDLWHFYSGGEKTMDFSFLNAIVRSRVMPPYDPWFSGGYINYYYYGHFTAATLFKLAAITPAIAVNLAIPTFYALALATCASIGYNLLGLLRGGALSAVLAMVSGNLVAAGVLISDLQGAGPLHADLAPVSTPGLGAPFVGGLIDLVGGTWSAFAGLVRGTLAAVLGLGDVLFRQASLPQYAFVAGWPWNQSRVIDNSQIITEFPFWTFLFADPHAHLWDLPFALCVLAIAFNFALGGPRTGSRGSDEEADARWRSLLPGAGVVIWPVLGTVAGAIGPTNPWDLAEMLAALALAIGAYALTHGASLPRALGAVAWRMVLIVVFAFGLYAPFYTHFYSFYSQIGWTLLRHQTPIGDFLTHFGVFIFILASYLLTAVLATTRTGTLLRRQIRAWLFSLYYSDRGADLPRYFALVRRRAAYSTPSSWARAVLLLASPLVVLLAAIQYQVLALLAVLIAAALLLLVDRTDPAGDGLVFLHLLIILGLGVAATAEIVYEKDYYDADPRPAVAGTPSRTQPPPPRAPAMPSPVGAWPGWRPPCC